MVKVTEQYYCDICHKESSYKLRSRIEIKEPSFSGMSTHHYVYADVCKECCNEVKSLIKYRRLLTPLSLKQKAEETVQSNVCEKCNERVPSTEVSCKFTCNLYKFSVENFIAGANYIQNQKRKK